LCKRATGNIAVSLHVAQRISLPRTQTIYHGIEDAVPAAGALPKHPENCLQLGYVGRLVEEKGVRVLLEAAKRLHENRLRFHLKIIGDGPQRAELEKMSRDSGLSECVTFAGLLTGPELQRQVNAIRVMVIPSVCEETAGLAAIEQMMRGEVVVAAEIGGLGEIVGDAGLKFKAGDPESLYRVFKRMIEEPSVITPLPLAARARAMRLFGRENMIQQHVSLYREALRFAKRRESSEVPGGSTDDRANHHFPSGRVDT
ncbi:MAG: glycosyltransferase family 4 protein, partial [Candidatus Acidiferrales bacterium]